jgi:cytidylate kinase
MDKTRTASPLYNAPDAVVIDTTAKDVQQVVAEVLALIGERPARS